MVAYLKGIIKYLTSETVTLVILDAIGYQVWAPEDELASLNLGQKIEIFCYHHITDRSQELYGFLSLEKKEFFKLLIDNVSGVGPKSALKILGKVNFEQLKQAIRQTNALQLAAMGVGKKTAEKIIAGLKDKIGCFAKLTNSQFGPPHLVETVDALTSLGYSKTEAQTAVSQINLAGKTLEEIIKEALKIVR